MILLIGYMHYRKRPHDLKRAYAFASVAKAEGADLLFFSPNAVDITKKRISGYIYRNSNWVKIESVYPDVICNVIGFAKDRQIDIYNELQNEIPFIHYPIGDKLTVFHNLMKHNVFSNYIVPSDKVQSVDHFFILLDSYKQIVLKPSSGCRGADIYYISREDTSFKVISGALESYYNRIEIIDLISDKIKSDEYIVQPYINSRTISGEPYDFRLHVQKGLNGKWADPYIYPRISSDGGIVCNISRGGYTYKLIPFLKREFKEDYYNIKKRLEIFSLQFAAHMDEMQMALYGEELSELGIDIGLTEQQKIYIYEVNWRPGHPPLMDLDLSIIRNTVQYAMYLAKRGF